MDKKEPVTVTVTGPGQLGWGIRIWVKVKLWWSHLVKSRREIGPTIQSDLRMIDKCDVDSPMAAASRDRNKK